MYNFVVNTFSARTLYQYIKNYKNNYITRLYMNFFIILIWVIVIIWTIGNFWFDLRSWWNTGDSFAEGFSMPNLNLKKGQTTRAYKDPKGSFYSGQTIIITPILWTPWPPKPSFFGLVPPSTTPNRWNLQEIKNDGTKYNHYATVQSNGQLSVYRPAQHRAPQATWILDQVSVPPFQWVHYAQNPLMSQITKGKDGLNTIILGIGRSDGLIYKIPVGSSSNGRRSIGMWHKLNNNNQKMKNIMFGGNILYGVSTAGNVWKRTLNGVWEPIVISHIGGETRCPPNVWKQHISSSSGRCWCKDPNGKNLDGRYNPGHSRRLSGGWAASHKGLPDLYGRSVQFTADGNACKEFCDYQPECASTLSTNAVTAGNTCLNVAKALFGSKVTARRNIVRGSWHWVPPGCSVQSGSASYPGGDWAAHYNRSSRYGGGVGHPTFGYKAYTQIQDRAPPRQGVVQVAEYAGKIYGFGTDGIMYKAGINKSNNLSITKTVGGTSVYSLKWTKLKNGPGPGKFAMYIHNNTIYLSGNPGNSAATAKLFKSSTSSSGSWQQLASGSIKCLCVWDDYVYGVGSNNYVYRVSVNGGGWKLLEQTGGSHRANSCCVTWIDIIDGVLWGLGTNGQLYWRLLPSASSAWPDPKSDCDGKWGAWTACIAGTRKKSRAYIVSKAAVGSGKKCPVAQIASCVPNIGCMGKWTDWGVCDSSTRTQKRTYTITQQTSGTGGKCPASPETQTCVPNIDCQGSWAAWGKCGEAAPGDLVGTALTVIGRDPVKPRKNYTLQGAQKFTKWDNYALSFTIKPLSKQSGWRGIIHNTMNGGNCCHNYERWPGIWFYHNTTRMHIRWQNNKGVDPSYHLPLGQKSTVTAIVNNATVRVIIRDKYNNIKFDQSTTLSAHNPPINPSRQKFYMCGPWYNPADVEITELILDSNVSNPTYKLPEKGKAGVPGSQKRVFQVTKQQSGTGKQCPRPSETQSCVTGVSDKDCVGFWTSWGACDPTTDKRSRRWKVTTAASGSGKPCPSSPETQKCVPDLDCKGEWSTWGRCGFKTKNQTRQFIITSKSRGAGKPCPEDQIQDCIPTHTHLHEHEKGDALGSSHTHEPPVPPKKDICITPQQLEKADQGEKWLELILSKSKCIDGQAAQKAVDLAKPDILTAISAGGEWAVKSAPHLKGAEPHLIAALDKAKPFLEAAAKKAEPHLKTAFAGPPPPPKESKQPKPPKPVWGDAQLRRRAKPNVYVMANQNIIKPGTGFCPNGCKMPQYDNTACKNEVFKGKEYRNCPWLGDGSIESQSCRRCGAILMAKNKFGYARTRPGLFDNISLKSALTSSTNSGIMKGRSANINYVKVGRNFMNELAKIKDFSLPYVSQHEFANIGRIVYKYEMDKTDPGTQKTKLTDTINNILNTSNLPNNLLKNQNSFGGTGGSDGIGSGGGQQGRRGRRRQGRGGGGGGGGRGKGALGGARNNAKKFALKGGSSVRSNTAYKQDYKPFDPRKNPKPYDSIWDMFRI